MNMHKNARLTPLGRERIVRQVESGQTPEAVSETAGVVQNFGRGGSLFGQGGPSVQFGAPGPFDRAPGGGNWFSQPFGPR